MGLLFESRTVWVQNPFYWASSRGKSKTILKRKQINNNNIKGMGVKLQAGKQMAIIDQERDRSLLAGPGNR